MNETAGQDCSRPTVSNYPNKGCMTSIMPLKQSGSKAAVSRNIHTELAAGKPRAQAVAIALNVARKNAAKKARGKRH